MRQRHPRYRTLFGLLSHHSLPEAPASSPTDHALPWRSANSAQRVGLWQSGQHSTASTTSGNRISPEINFGKSVS